MGRLWIGWRLWDFASKIAISTAYLTWIAKSLPLPFLIIRKNAHSALEDTQAPRPRLGRSRTSRKAPQASRRSWFGWWSAPPPVRFYTSDLVKRCLNLIFPHYSTNFDKYHPGYFGKVGMRRFHLTRNALWRPIINVDKLWSLVPAEQKKGLTESSTVVPVIDTLAAGYGKVLGNGK